MIVFWLILIFWGVNVKFFQFFSISSYGFSIIDIGFFGFAFTIAKRVIWDGVNLKFSKSSSLAFISIFVASTLLSVANPLLSGNPILLTQFLKTSVHLYYIVFFFYLIYIYPIKEKEWISLIQSLLIMSILINVFGVYQIFARTFDLPFAWIEISNVSMKTGVDKYDEFSQLSLQFANFFRATSIFYEPSALALFNINTLAFILPPIITKSKNFFSSKLLVNTIVSLCFVSLFLTFSLTGAMGFAILMLMIFVIERKINFKQIFIVTLLVGIVIFIADSIASNFFNVSVLDLFTSRIANLLGFQSAAVYEIQGESFGGRLANIYENLELWSHYPITGFGLGCFRYNPYNESWFADISMLGILSETGIIGFVSFLGIFIALTAKLYKLNQNAKVNTQLSSNAKLLFSVLIYTLAGQYQTHFVSGNQFISESMWTVFAMIASISSLYYVNYSHNYIEFSIMKTPLKDTVARIVNLNAKK